MAMTNQYDWKRLKGEAIKLLRSGKVRATWPELSHALKVPRATLQTGFLREFSMDAKDLIAISGRNPYAVGEGESRYQGIDPQKIIKILKHKPRSLSEIADMLDRGRPTVEKCVRQMIEDDYGVVKDEKMVSMPPYAPPDPLPTLYDSRKKSIKFAVLSDPHFGSRHIQASALLRFLRVAYEDYGVSRFFWAGDMTAGYGVYRGQQNDLYAFSADDQVDSLCNTIPQWPGVQHVMLGGNHDYSFMKSSGHNVIKAAAKKRSDFIYAGFDQAEIPMVEIDGKVISSAVLWHPSGGVPYALSYRGQKFAAEVTREELTEVVLDEKPSPTVRFVFWGHLHVADWFPYGPMEIMGPGCFEGTNGYLKQKGLRPVIRGLIMEVDVTDRGLIAASHIHPISFVEKEEDYHAAFNPLRARDVTATMEPVFSMTGREGKNETPKVASQTRKPGGSVPALRPARKTKKK